MKNKGVLVLGAAVVLLSAYAYFGEYKREINETEKKETDSKIVSFKKDQIQKIELNKGGGAQVILERTVDGWNVMKPVSDQADNEIVEAFLDQITGEKAVDTIKFQVSKLGEYGFAPSLGTVALFDNQNHRLQIEVGSKKNFEGLIFLRRDQENNVLTSSETWLSFLTKPSDQFRNLKFYRGTISKVNGIRITNKQGSFDFKSVDAQWIHPGNKNWKIDQNSVREILAQMGLVKGSEIVPKTPGGQPVLTIELEESDGQKWKGSLYQDSKTKDVIGQMTSPNLNLRFPPQALEELRYKSLGDFRDKTEPFRFDKQDVQKIVAKTVLKNFSLVKAQDGAWKLEKEDPQFVVNTPFVEALITKLGNLKVYRFLNKPKSKPVLDSVIELLDEKGQSVFQLSFGEFKDHEGPTQTSVYPDVFLMDDAQLNQLALRDVVIPKPQQKEEKK